MVAFLRFYWARIVIITTLALTLLSPPAIASQLDAKRSELQNVKARIEANRSRQATAEKRQAEIIREIQLNDQKVAQLQKELINLHAELDKTIARRQAIDGKLDEMQKKLEASKEELAIAQAKLAQRRKVYNERVASIYKDGGSKVLTMLLSSKNLSDAVKRATLISIIAENDGKLLREMKQVAQTISDKIVHIEAEKKAIAEQRQRIIDEENNRIAIKNRIIARQKLFQDELNRQNTLLTRVQREKIQLEHAEDVLGATSNMIAEQIRTIERRELKRKRDASLTISSNPTPNEPATPGVKAGKSLIRPVSGPITSKFGWRFHPILKQSRLHTGIDFRVSSGTPVRAAQDGTVIIAGWKGGYGNTVVISHGDSLTTLYAHNSAITVGVGQYVSQGQVVAYSGSTGLSTGPHVHFETRIDGSPVNPASRF